MSKSSNSSKKIKSVDADVFSDELKVNILYQGKKSGNVNNDSVILNSKDMKQLRLKPGNHLLINVMGGKSIVCKAWSSSQAVSGGIVMNRFWQFNQPSGERISTIHNPIGRLFNQICSHVILVQVDGVSNKANHDNKFFLSYLFASLHDVTLSIGNIFQVQWKANAISYQLSSADTSISSSVFSSIENAVHLYIITPSTIISFRDHAAHAASPVNHITQLSSSIHSQSHEHIKVDLPRDVLLKENMQPVTISDVKRHMYGGYDEQVQEVLALVNEGLFQTDKYSEAGNIFKCPRGVLISGAKGTGKTALMKAIAASLNGIVNCYSLRHDIFLLRYQGDAEAEIKRVFEEASKRSPSLILLDDVDLLCKQRSEVSQGSELQRTIVSCILGLLDGGGTHKQMPGVFVIATSSKPNDIERAMRRPGRLDREVELSIPNAVERMNILETILQSMGVVATVNQVDGDPSEVRDGITTKCLRDVARLAHGMVAADLLLVCKEAHMQALDRNCRLKNISTPVAVMSELTRNIQGLSLSSIMDASESSDITQSLSHTSSTPLKDTAPISSDSLVTDTDLIRAVGIITPSAIREVSVEVSEVRWSDIGGMNEVKQSLKEVVEWPLHHPELFISMGITPPRGVLLYGPPGCSKTLMAKALATESGLNFLAVRGPELLSKWLGDSEKAVQTLFRRARAAAPCLIFFDEIDAFACKRGESSSGVNDRVLSQLLTEIDSFNSDKRVIVVAATNRPDMLDAALIRPGRIDRKIYVPPPDKEARTQILDINLKKMPLQIDVDISSLADKTYGFSGAEVVAICSEGALHALDENASAVSQDHLLRAISDIKPQITPTMIAFYENLVKSFK